jgi:drug/metabolite transporter (DMT)-like permease
MRKNISIFALFITSAIWGLAFVAQRQGMELLDPFLFNGIRFALGAVFIGCFGFQRIIRHKGFPWSLGLVLFLGATFQQTGLIWSTAGNAGFITGLYVVFVPILGLFRSQRIKPQILYAVCLSLFGLYLINDNQDITVSFSNALILIGAVFWAVHLQLIDKLNKSYDYLYLAFIQFSVCACLSFFFGILYNLVFQTRMLFSQELFLNVGKAGLPLLYSGLVSVGIAYTLQVFAQKRVEPAKSAIILCLESVFALWGGWLLLGETITPAALLGAGMLLLAMLISIKVTPWKRISVFNRVK